MLGVQPTVLNYIIVLLGGCKVINLTGEGRGAVLTVECESEWWRYKGVVKYHASVKYPYTVLVSGLVPNHTTFPPLFIIAVKLTTL